MTTSALLNFSDLLLQFGLFTVLHNSMENSSGYGSVLVRAGTRLRDEEVSFILLKVPNKCTAICLIE